MLLVPIRSRLAVKPVKAEAVLFYSQHADGSMDQLSEHAGCPVIEVSHYTVHSTTVHSTTMYMLHSSVLVLFAFTEHGVHSSN